MLDCVYPPSAPRLSFRDRRRGEQPDSDAIAENHNRNAEILSRDLDLGGGLVGLLPYACLLVGLCTPMRDRGGGQDLMVNQASGITSALSSAYIYIQRNEIMTDEE